MNDSEGLAIVQCAENSEAFVDYIQARDKSLTRAEATWVMAAVIAGLPDLFSANEFLLQCLDRIASEFRAAKKPER
jgi:hypothetical protein